MPCNAPTRVPDNHTLYPIDPDLHHPLRMRVIPVFLPRVPLNNVRNAVYRLEIVVRVGTTSRGRMTTGVILGPSVILRVFPAVARPCSSESNMVLASECLCTVLRNCVLYQGQTWMDTVYFKQGSP